MGRPDPIELRARYLLVADGANSRFGRTLGTLRTADWPNATAIRGYWQSPRHAEPYVETSLDLTDHHGNLLPGYGWVIPVGDGTVNVGVGLLSTFREFRSINATHLLQQHLERVAPDWQIEPDRPLGRAAPGRVPVGGSISPKAGPTYLVVGDAAGSVNPFSGTGIGEAFHTAALATEVLHQALDTNDPTVLQQYPARYDEVLGQYFHVGRLMARALGRPTVMRQLARASVSNQSVLEWLVRIMADALRPDDHGPAEAAYATAAALARLAPGS